MRCHTCLLGLLTFCASLTPLYAARVSQEHYAEDEPPAATSAPLHTMDYHLVNKHRVLIGSFQVSADTFQEILQLAAHHSSFKNFQNMPSRFQYYFILQGYAYPVYLYGASLMAKKMGIMNEFQSFVSKTSTASLQQGLWGNEGF